MIGTALKDFNQKYHSGYEVCDGWVIDWYHAEEICKLEDITAYTLSGDVITIKLRTGKVIRLHPEDWETVAE